MQPTYYLEVALTSSKDNGILLVEASHHFHRQAANSRLKVAVFCVYHQTNSLRTCILKTTLQRHDYLISKQQHFKSIIFRTIPESDYQSVVSYFAFHAPLEA